MILLTVEDISMLICNTVLYISTLGHARKLKFSSYVNVTSVNKIFQYCHNRVTLGNVGEVYNFEHGLYISPLKHAGLLILSTVKPV